MNFSPAIPLWLLGLLVGLASVSASLAYWDTRKRLGRGRSSVLGSLRLASILLLVVFAFDPGWITLRQEKALPPLTVILDTSPAMGLPGPSGTTRLDEAKAIVRTLLEELGGRLDVKVYGLGASLKPVDQASLSTLTADERRGNLDEALANLGEQGGFALLLSDGGLGWDEESPPGIPVVTYPLGDYPSYKDITIVSVKVPVLAFRGREAKIDVTLKGHGFEGIPVPVLLKEGDRLLATRTVPLARKGGTVTASFSYTPSREGETILSASVPARPDEAMTLNNSRLFPVKVLRDKLRILMISGVPSMSYRFMRAALKADPSIDLLSFVILRTPSNVVNVPLEEQSLIPFPVDTLFGTEIDNFDLLIFDDFTYQTYLAPHHLGNLKDYVKNGKGFAWIGGPNSSGGGVIAGSLDEVLPVRFAGKEPYRRSGSVPVRVTKAGMTHPITALEPHGGEPGDFWRETAPLDGINQVEARKGSTVLIEGASGSAWPILALGTYGDGRVLALATDDSWKWSMGMVAAGRGNMGYLRFVDRMIRWLTKDPALEPVAITWPEAVPLAGQKVEFRLKLAQGTGNTKGTPSVWMVGPDGAKKPVSLAPLGQGGEYRGSFPAPTRGAYRVGVERPEGTHAESFVVAGAMEALDGVPDHDRLRMIASSTGGTFVAKRDDLRTAIDAQTARLQQTFVSEQRSSILRMPYLAGLLVLLLSAEWYLRRRWGLA